MVHDEVPCVGFKFLKKYVFTMGSRHSLHKAFCFVLCRTVVNLRKDGLVYQFMSLFDAVAMFCKRFIAIPAFDCRSVIQTKTIHFQY